MSKFQDLCNTYSTARQNYFDYWQECADFVTELVDSMTRYFEMPADKLKFVPLKQPPEFGKTYCAKESMHLEQDTFWYAGVMLTLCHIKKDEPDESIILPILVKKIGDEFTVKLGPMGKPLAIKKGDNYREFYDYVYNQILDTYKDRLHKFLEKESSERKIGFAAD